METKWTDKITDATGKKHAVAIGVEYDTCTSESGAIDRDYIRIVADVDGERLFSHLPVWKFDHKAIQNAIHGMVRSVDYFLSAHHHPTHYTGRFAYLAGAK